MNICKVDSNMIFSGETKEQSDLRSAIPRGWVATSSPKKEGIWQWGSDRWIELVEYPKQPEPPPVVESKTWYSPDLIVQAIDAMGKAEELEAMLAHASPRIRLRWQKAILFDGADRDFISIVDYFQESWKLTTEQREQLLKSCETTPING